MAINIPQNIIVHHSLSINNKSQLQGINNHHKKLKFPKSSLGYYVGYHFLVSWEGEVTQTRVARESGAHCSQKLMNYRSIGICLEGNFDEMYPSDAQCKALDKLIKRLCSIYAIDEGKVFPHRHFAKYKSCWGSKLPNDIIGYLENRLRDAEEKKGRSISPWAKESAQEAKELRLWVDQTNPDDSDSMKITYYLKKVGILTKIPKDKDGNHRPANIEEINHGFYKAKFGKFAK